MQHSLNKSLDTALSRGANSLNRLLLYQSTREMPNRDNENVTQDLLACIAFYSAGPAVAKARDKGYITPIRNTNTQRVC
jgi:hypothetical protein